MWLDPLSAGLWLAAQTLFINFEGADLARGCEDARQDCTTTPLHTELSGQILPYSGNAADRFAIVQEVRRHMAPFGVVVVAERPVGGEPYAMVLVGNSPQGGPSHHGFSGIAPGADCQDAIVGQTAFALEAFTNPKLMATVISHEAGHAWGLEHVDSVDGIMRAGGQVTQRQFHDACLQVEAEGGAAIDGVCAVAHQVYCSPGGQNSFQELAALFGPPVPDEEPPQVDVVQPAEGVTLPFPAAFDVVIEVDDDRTPQMLDVRLELDGDPVVAAPFVEGELRFPVQGGIAEGEHALSVIIADEAGNAAIAQRLFALSRDSEAVTTGATTHEATGGGETEAGTQAEDTAASGRGCRAGGGGRARLVAWVVLAGLSVRRRRG